MEKSKNPIVIYFAGGVERYEIALSDLHAASLCQYYGGLRWKFLDY